MIIVRMALLPLLSIVLLAFPGTSPAAEAHIVQEVVALVKKHFWKEETVPVEVQSSLNGLYEYLEKIDPYSSVDTARSPKIPVQGFYGGVLLAPPAGGDYLLYPVQGGKMVSAGFIKPVILRGVSGHTVSSKSHNKVLGLFQQTQEVEISYLESPGGVIKRATLERGTDELPHVMRHDLGYGPYIQILRFEFGRTARAIKKLLASDVPGEECLILDLRYNQGGDVAELASVAEIFANRRGPVGVLKYRQGSKPPHEKIRVLQPLGVKGCQPFIIISKYTASAAEILAIALQRLADAKLLGERTFGKCQSQRKFNLSNGHELKFTNASFASNSNGCKYEGLSPEIELDVTHASVTDIALFVMSLSLDNSK